MMNNEYSQKLLTKIENYVFQDNELLSKNCIDEKVLYNLGFRVAYTKLSNYCIDKGLMIVVVEEKSTKHLELHKLSKN